MSYIADTTLLIDYLRGREKATEYVSKIIDGEIVAYISVITEAEIFCGMKDEEMVDVLSLLSHFTVEDVDSIIAQTGGTFYHDYGQYMGKSSEEDKRPLLDALIAATAKKLNKILITRNYKHFKPLEDAGHITCEPYKEENQGKQ